MHSYAEYFFSSHPIHCFRPLLLGWGRQGSLSIGFHKEGDAEGQPIGSQLEISSGAKMDMLT